MPHNRLTAIQNLHCTLQYPIGLMEEPCKFIQKANKLENFYITLGGNRKVVPNALTQAGKFIAKRIAVLSIPIFALTNVLYATIASVNLLRFKIEKKQYVGDKFPDTLEKIKDLYLGSIRTLTFWIVTLPVALIVPDRVYLTSERWDETKYYNKTRVKGVLKKLDNNVKNPEKKININNNANKNFKVASCNKELLAKIRKAQKSKSLEIFDTSELDFVPKEILTHLKKLYFAKSKNTSIPSKIGQLKNLEKLFCVNPNIKSIPSQIGRLSKLKELDINHAKIRSIPAEVGKLSNLKELYLNDNRLSNIPKDLGQLSSLKLLILTCNHLSNIPAELGQLSNLEELCLTRNLLSSLPAELGQLSNLKRLSLSCNLLSSLPAELGQLSNLKKLDLHDNRLSSLPAEIGQLSNLKELDLYNSRLSSLPAELGQLSNLKALKLGNNKNLRDLPLSLGQIPELMYIDISGTQISQQACDAILAQCRALRDANAPQRFASRLKTWQAIGGSQLDLSGVSQFDEKKKSDLMEWLTRLEITKDFDSSTQSALAKTVCQMLESAINDKDFQELFFVQIASNLECCGDRAAMALNEIYTLWRLSKLPKEASIGDKLQIMQQGAKTVCLRSAIAKRIDQHQKKNQNIEQEAVEIYLYYECSLKNELNLLSAINRMSYESIGKRDWINKANLVKEVNKSYLDHLITFSQFKEMVEKDNDYIQNCNEKTSPLKARINQLMEKEPKDQDVHSEAYLNWQHQIGQLTAKMNEKVIEIQKEWALKYLKN